MTARTGIHEFNRPAEHNDEEIKSVPPVLPEVLPAVTEHADHQLNGE